MKLWLSLALIGALAYEHHELEEERWESIELRSRLVRAEQIHEDIAGYCDGMQRLKKAERNYDFSRAWALNLLKKPREQ